MIFCVNEMEGIHVHSGLSDWIGSAEGAMDAFPEQAQLESLVMF